MMVFYDIFLDKHHRFAGYECQRLLLMMTIVNVSMHAICKYEIMEDWLFFFDASALPTTVSNPPALTGSGLRYQFAQNTNIVRKNDG
jgi:hypothetical protein